MRVARRLLYPTARRHVDAEEEVAMSSFTRSLIVAGILTATAGIAAAQGGPRGGHGRPDPATHYEKLARFDADKNGKLDAAELAKLKAAREAERTARIAKFDKDKDGALNDAERVEARKARVGEIFVELDTDKNGSLSKAEFEAGAQKLMKHRRGGKGMRQGRMGQGRMMRGKGQGQGQGQGPQR